MISNVNGAEVHPFSDAVAVTVPVIAAKVLFVVTKEGTLPEPLPAKPIAVFEFVQVTAAVFGVTVNTVCGMVTFSQSTILDTAAIIGVGLIVIVKLTGAPTHEFSVGVTETVPLIGVEPVLVPWKAVMLPVPLAPSPIAVFVFVQAKVAPFGVLVNAAGLTDPTHWVMFVGTVTSGVGLTVIVYVPVFPIQPFKVGVTVIVPLETDEPLFVATKLG